MAKDDWSVVGTEDDWEPVQEAPAPVAQSLPTLGQSMEEEMASRPAWEQVLGGVGTAPALAYEGIKGLFGRTNHTNVDEQRALRDTNWNARGGNIAGNLGMAYMLPVRAGAGMAGMIGGRVPAMVAGRGGMLGDTVLTAGALGAVLEPGGLAERAKAGITSMVASAAAPALTALGQGVRRMTTSTGRQIAVGEALRREVGSKADDLAAALRGTDDAAMAVGVKPSSAMLTKNPVLEVLESGSRAKRADLWRGVDGQNAQARWDALLTRASTKEHLDLLKEARDASTKAMRDKAMTMAETSVLFEKAATIPPAELKSVLARLDDLTGGAMRPNKDVQTLAAYVRKELENGISPRQLYEMRKYLTDGIKAGRADELSQAAKAARPQRIELVQQFDDILNKLSGGEYGDYMKSYAAQSKPITSTQAMQDIVGALERGQPVGQVPAAMTAASNTVGRLRDSYGSKQIGSQTFDRFLPEDRSFMNSLTQNLADQARVMSSKATLGSPTAGLLANIGRAEATTRFLKNGAQMLPIPGGGILASKALDEAGNRAEQELARLLQNPEALALALDRAKVAEQLMRRASGAGAASAAANR